MLTAAFEDWCTEYASPMVVATMGDRPIREDCVTVADLLEFVGSLESPDFGQASDEYDPRQILRIAFVVSKCREAEMSAGATAEHIHDELISEGWLEPSEARSLVDQVRRVEKHMAFRERLGSDSSPHYEIRAALSGQAGDPLIDSGGGNGAESGGPR